MYIDKLAKHSQHYARYLIKNMSTSEREILPSFIYFAYNDITHSPTKKSNVLFSLCFTRTSSHNNHSLLLQTISSLVKTFIKFKTFIARSFTKEHSTHIISYLPKQNEMLLWCLWVWGLGLVILWTSTASKSNIKFCHQILKNPMFKWEKYSSKKFDKIPPPLVKDIA